METKLLKLKKIKKIESKSLNYDIQIKDNHNFFANDILVHNSLGIMFFYGNEWRVATSGSFASYQSIWAAKWMEENMPLDKIDKTNSYILEIVYDGNRIVIPYDYEGLVLLGIIDSFGLEYDYEQLKKEAVYMGTRCILQYDFNDIDSILENAATLDYKEEGYVIRFKNGMRMKIKGDEYVKIHKIISKVTPLSIWESILEGKDLEELKKELPEEMIVDFNTIVSSINKKLNSFVEEVELLHENTKHMTDKELGLYMKEHPEAFDGGEFEETKRFIFMMRQGRFYNSLSDNTSTLRRKVFESFRPKNNVIKDYVPSTAMNRFSNDF